MLMTIDTEQRRDKIPGAWIFTVVITLIGVENG